MIVMEAMVATARKTNEPPMVDASSRYNSTSISKATIEPGTMTAILIAHTPLVDLLAFRRAERFLRGLVKEDCRPRVRVCARNIGLSWHAPVCP